jgi:hypothetical protein
LIRARNAAVIPKVIGTAFLFQLSTVLSGAGNAFLAVLAYILTQVYRYIGLFLLGTNYFGGREFYTQILDVYN